MAEKIKENKEIAFLAVVGLVLVAVGLVAVFDVITVPESVEAAVTATSTVTVQATVSPFISISLSTTSVNIIPNLIDTAGTYHVGSSTNVTATVSTNDSAGYTLGIKGANAGLATGTAKGDDLIATVSPTSTAATGTDAYGANASSSHADVKDNYNYWGTVDIGEIASTTSNTVSDEDSDGANRQTDIKIYASCVEAKPSGVYADTITLTATGKTN